MKVDQLETFLRGCSCFAVLTDSELELLRDRSEIRSYKLGEVLFRQGDLGEEMYLVYSGKVRVLREENGDEIPLNVLYPGEHFGELALVSRRPRNATIRAAADSTLIAIPADAVTEVVDRNQLLRQYFDQYAERIELWNFIKLVGQLGSQLKPSAVRRLVDRFEGRAYEASETILFEGQVPQQFFLIQSGRVKVLRNGNVQASLTSGDTFGGSALVQQPPEQSRFTISADGSVQVMTLSADDFQHLLDESPAVRSYFEEQVSHVHADEAADHFATISVRLDRGDREDADGDNRATSILTAAAGEPSSPTVETGQTSAFLPADAKTIETEKPAVEAEPVEAAPVAAKPLGFWQRWRFAFIPQHDEVDCGAASLAMITAYYGRAIGVTRLRDLAGVGTDGASLVQLSHAAAEVGYQTRSLRLSLDGLGRLRLPAILFWRGYHYVVLYAFTEHSAYVADPAFGKIRIPREEFAHHYSGYALEVSPTNAAENVRSRTHAARRVVSLLSQHWRTLVIILVTSLLLDLFGLAPALFTQHIVDNVVQQQQSISMLNLVALGMLAVSAMQIGTTVLRGLIAVRMSQALDRTLLQEFYAHLLTLPTHFFKLRRTGDIFARFDDNQSVRELFTAGTLTAILDSLMVVVFLVVMFHWNPRLALVVMVFVPLLVGFTLLVSPIMKRQHRQLLEEQAAHESNLIESIGGIDLVKAMSIERSVQQKWQQLFDRFLSTQLRSEKLGQTFGAIGSALGVLSTVALLWYGASLVLRGELTIGEFMGFNMLAGQVTGPLSRVVGLWDQLQQARVSLERVSDVLDNDPEPQPDPEARVYPEVIEGRVKFDRVFFNYGGQGSPNVLRGVSFEARPGQRIAIVGRSGSGKTTLARLLLGLYHPSEGTITIDRWDLRRLDLATYRRQVGFVLQENLLFSGTIRENIALGDAEPDLQRIEESAVLAGAHEFISSMPLGYNTVVGELGLTLSGGQRQRISMSRALYRNPRILILDEATSALDSLSEREIQKNLDAILADRTAFIIAHKIATVRDADLILVLHDGTIVEQGTHDELIARRSTYYYLAAQQLNL